MCRPRTTPARSRSQGDCTTSRTTPWPGEVVMTASLKIASGQAGPRAPARSAADVLHETRAREGTVGLTEAAAGYEAAIEAAERAGERAVLAEALRRRAGYANGASPSRARRATTSSLPRR